MNTLQLLPYLQRIYDQKAALLKKKDTPEYNEDQYNHLMTFYNGKIEELRTRAEKKRCCNIASIRYRQSK